MTQTRKSTHLPQSPTKNLPSIRRNEEYAVDAIHCVFDEPTEPRPATEGGGVEKDENEARLKAHNEDSNGQGDKSPFSLVVVVVVVTIDSIAVRLCWPHFSFCPPEAVLTIRTVWNPYGIGA